MSGRGSGRGRSGGRGGRGGDYYRNRYGSGGRGRSGVGRGGGIKNAVGGVGDGTNNNGVLVSAVPPPQDAPRPSDEIKVNGGSDKVGGVASGSSFQSQQAGRGSSFDPNIPKLGGNNGGTHTALIELLRRIDGKNYPAFHDIESSTKGWVHDTEGYSLYIARAQSDPFAKPTRCRVVIKSAAAKFPPVSYQNKIRSVALGDYLNRMLYDCCKNIGADVSAEYKGGYHGGGGDIEVSQTISLFDSIFNH